MKAFRFSSAADKRYFERSLTLIRAGLVFLQKDRVVVARQLEADSLVESLRLFEVFVDQ